MNVDPKSYERFIQSVRHYVALAFALAGIGLIGCAHLRLGYAAVTFAIAAFLCLAIVLVLIVEQVVTAWIVKRRGRISLAGILLLTTFAAMTFTVMRISVSLALVLLAMAFVFVACALEWKREAKRSVSARSPGTNAELWLAAYEAFVAKVAAGQSMCLYVYARELQCRSLLEERRQDPAVQAIWPRVVAADDALRPLLRPTKICIHNDHPPSWFWYWGYPPHDRELTSDLKTLGAIE